MNIRLANNSDLDQLNIMFKDVIKDMKQKNINMWNDVYPFCEFEHDIANKEMYVIEDNNEIIGSFVLSNFDDPDYKLINWNYNENWISLNRLAILPCMQGKGYAKEAMKYIEKEAVNRNCDAIRLTVYEQNVNAIGLYEKFNFKRVKEGSYFINGNRFVGYEKKI